MAANINDTRPASRWSLAGSRMGLCTAVCAALLGTAAHVAAQSYPTKPIRIIVSTPPGSGGDIVSRTIAQALSERYPHQVVVENRAGAGGLIGAQAIQQAAPDGYTIGLASTAHVVAPMLQAKPPYRPIEDFTPIIRVGEITNIVIVGPSMPARTLPEFLSQAKAKPGSLNFLSLGDGTAAHLAAVIFNRAAGIDVVHVPFKTVADANTAIMNGDVHYGVFLVPPSVQLIRSGKIRGLAVTSDKRLASHPDIPTVHELGLPAAASSAMLGYVGPANLPRELVHKLHDDMVAVLQRADIRERLAGQVVLAADTAPGPYAAALRTEFERYGKLIEEIGLKRR